VRRLHLHARVVIRAGLAYNWRRGKCVLTHIDCWTASKFKAICFVYLAAEIRDPAGIGVQEIFCFFIFFLFFIPLLSSSYQLFLWEERE